MTVTGMGFHPMWSQILFALTEGGDIHVIDLSIGSITNSSVAQIKINSTMAIDTQNMRALVIGDTGRAIMFDCAMGANDLYTRHRRPKLIKDNKTKIVKQKDAFEREEGH
jgi:hypothetical protein